jgi:hypothetical protein
MEHLQTAYEAAYVALYDGMDELPSYPATVARFEYFTANSADFRRARFRLEELQGDHIISDREAAAFVLAAEQCGII